MKGASGVVIGIFDDEPMCMQTTVSVSTDGAVGAGQTKRYQYWYRDSGTSPCNSLFNLSNGYEITWEA